MPSDRIIYWAGMAVLAGSACLIADRIWPSSDSLFELGVTQCFLGGLAVLAEASALGRSRQHAENKADRQHDDDY